MKVMEHLKKAIRDAAIYNPEVQVAPACILWTDHDRQWEPVIPRLQMEMPELLVLGNYNPEKRTGPAIWLRCVLEGKFVHETHEQHEKNKKIEQPQMDTDGRKSSETNIRIDSHSFEVPILYLPGVSRQALRAVENCPEFLKPLAELQYRGVIWSQVNAKDWTVMAFLKSDQGGLGLDVSQDNDTRNSMLLALTALLDEKVTHLKGKHLDRDYFNELLTGGDPVKDLLQWMDQEEAFQKGRSSNEWKAFVELCKSKFAFNPVQEGILTGVSRLATHEGAWKAVWERFCEAPARYSNIPSKMRKASMPPQDLFSDESTHGGWPQWNDIQEKNLRQDLLELNKMPPHEARKKILELEKKHSRRRTLVWAELGESPLVLTLAHLAVLAETTQYSLTAGTLEDLVSSYSTQGWKSDDAVLSALAEIEPADFEIIVAVLRAVYLPWAEESARYLQKIWNPEGPCKRSHPPGTPECILFVDGLRFDCAKRLSAILEKKGITIQEKICWAALPSVTGTGKPAVVPLGLSSSVAEEAESQDFQVMTSYQFDKAMNDSGWLILRSKDPIPAPVQSTGSGYLNNSIVNKLWVEFGNIDHEGHDRGWKLAKHLEGLLEEISDRIQMLLSSGWKTVRVVTDHGWLLLPGGLPKGELSNALVESKWGRCASLKKGVHSEEKLYPWYWNPIQHFALAEGISCFRKGEEYTHGGLSLQECVTLELVVSEEKRQQSISLEFTDVVWKGMRCTVALTENFEGLSLDIRKQPGNPESSVVVGVKPIKENGTASVVVENEDLQGQEVTLVLMDAKGSLVAQIATVVGENRK
ncbi:BREX-1 system phosphatase PglZ type B [Deltaproteobacteria bacterium TL4]